MCVRLGGGGEEGGGAIRAASLTAITPTAAVRARAIPSPQSRSGGITKEKELSGGPAGL